MQQTAAFLLWYHALEGGEDKVAELASNNIINVCLTIMDSAEASPVDKSCCAGESGQKAESWQQLCGC